MKIQYTILYMYVRQPSQLKYQLGTFIQVSVGRLYPNVQQRCSGWWRESDLACASL